ncbi:uncharacterized protein LOC135488926 [Lineus longissimus]|uniref:uncharacterized protein LOC135488926 n=1 Tax=Lineus longissimus TaxID=88925 RepID=UPI002B4CD31B
MAQSSRMDQFTFDKMGRNLRKHQYLFCRRLDAVEVLRLMGDTLTESNVGSIKAKYKYNSPDEGMDEFIDFVKKKKSAMERFRNILRSSPDYNDLADVLEEGVSARPRTNAAQASNVPCAAYSQRPPAMTSIRSQQTTRERKPTKDTKLTDLDQTVFLKLSENLQTTASDIPGMECSWRALAAELGFTHRKVSLIGKMNDPVDKLLQYWIQADGECCTLGKLMLLLQKIERYDIISEIENCTGYQYESQLHLRRDDAHTASREMTSPSTQQSSTAPERPDVPLAMLGHIERTTELVNQTQQNLEDVDGKKSTVVSVEPEEAEQKSVPLVSSRSRDSSRSKERSSVKDTSVSAVAMEADNKRRDSTVSVTTHQPDRTGPAPAQESEEPGSFHPDFSNESPLQAAQLQEEKEILARSGENVLESVPGQNRMELSARPGYSNVSLTHSIDDNDNDSIKMCSLRGSVSDDSITNRTEQHSADVEKGMLENVQRDKREKAEINELISLNVRGSQEIREQGQRKDSVSSHELVSAQDSGNSQVSLDSAENRQTKIKTVFGDNSSSNDAQFHVSNPSVLISGEVESGGHVNSGASQSRSCEQSEWSALTNFQRFKILLEAEANQNGSLDLSSAQGQSALNQPVLQRDLSSKKTPVTEEDYDENGLKNDRANGSMSEDSHPEQTIAKSLGMEIGIAGAEGGSQLFSEAQNLSDGVSSSSRQPIADQTGVKSVGLEVGIAQTEGGSQSCSEAQNLSDGVSSSSSQPSADQTGVKSVGLEVGIAQTEGSVESGFEHPGEPGQVVTGSVEKESETFIPNQQDLTCEVNGNRQSSDADIGSSFGCSMLKKSGCIKPVLNVEELHDLEGAKQAGLVQDVSDSGKCSTYCGDEDCSLHKVSADGPVEEVEVVAKNDGETGEDKIGELEAVRAKTEEIDVGCSQREEFKSDDAKTEDNSLHTQSESEPNSMRVVMSECNGNECGGSDRSSSAVVIDPLALPRGAEVGPEPEQFGDTMDLGQDSQSRQSRNEQMTGMNCSDEEQVSTSVSDRGVCSVQDSLFSSMPTNGVELFPTSAQRSLPQLNTNNNSRQQTTFLPQPQDLHDNSSPVISKSSKHFKSKELEGQESVTMQRTPSPILAQSHQNESQNNDSSDTLSQHSITLEQGEELTKPAENKCGESDSCKRKCVSLDTSVADVWEAGISATECPAKTFVVRRIELSASVDSEIGHEPDFQQEPNSRIRRSEPVSYEDSVEELGQGFEPELRPCCENVVTIGRVEVIQNLPIRKARISRVQFETDDEGLDLDEEALERHLKVDFTGGLGHTFRSTEDVHCGPKNTASVLEINKTDQMKRSASYDDITPIARKRLQRIPSKEEGDSVGCFPKKMSFLGCCTGGKLPKFTSKPFKQSDIYKKWMSFSWQREGGRKSTASESDKETISNMSIPDPDMHLKEPVYPSCKTEASSNETLELDVDPSLVGDSGIGTSENTMLTASRTLSDYSEDVSTSAELNLPPRSRKQRSLTEIFDSLPDGSNSRHIETTRGWDVIWQNGTPVGSLTCLTDEHHYKSNKECAGKNGGNSDAPKKSEKRSDDDPNPDLESSGSHSELNVTDSKEPGRDRCFSLDTWISDDIEASLSGIEEVSSPSSALPPKQTKTGKETTSSFGTRSEQQRRKRDAPKNIPIRFLHVVTSTPVKGDQVKPNMNADVGQRKGSGKRGKKGTLKPLSLSPEKIRSRQPATSPSSSHSHSAKFLYDHWSPSPSRSSSEVGPAENQGALEQETSAFNQRTPSAENLVNLVPGMTSYIHNIEKTVVDLTNEGASFQQNQPGELVTPSSSQTYLRKSSDGECQSSRKSSTSGNKGTVTTAPTSPAKRVVSSPLDDKTSAAGSSYALKQPSSSPYTARKHTDFGETIVTRMVMPDSNTSDRVSPPGQRSLRASQTPQGQQRPLNQKVGVEFGVTPNVIPTTQIVSTPAVAVIMETVSEMSGEVTVSSANTTLGSSGSNNQPSSSHANTPVVQLEPKNTDAGGRETRYVGQSAAKMAFLSGKTVRDPMNGNKYFYQFKNQWADSKVGETKPFQGDCSPCDVQDDKNSGEIDSSSEHLPSESKTASKVTQNVSAANDHSTGAHEKGRRNSDSAVPPLGKRWTPQARHLEGAVGGRETSASSSGKKDQTGAKGEGRRKSFGSDQRRGNLKTSQSVDGTMAGPSHVFDIGIGALRCAMTPTGIDIGLKLSSPGVRRHVLGQPSEENQRRLQISNREDTMSGVKESGQGSSSSPESSVETQDKKNSERSTLRIEGSNTSEVGKGQSELQHFENVSSQEEAVPATEVVQDSPLALCSQSPVILQPSSSPRDVPSHIVPAPSSDASDIIAPAPAQSAAASDHELSAIAPAQRAATSDLDLSESAPAPRVAASHLDLNETVSVPLVDANNHVPSTHSPAPRAAANNRDLRTFAPGPRRTLGVPRMSSAQGGDENNNVDEKMRKQSPESERMQELREYQETGEERGDTIPDARIIFGMEQDIQTGSSPDFVAEEALEVEVQIDARTDVGLPVVAETEAAIENVAIIDNNTMDKAVEMDQNVNAQVITEVQPYVETTKAAIAITSTVEKVLEADSPVVAETQSEPVMAIEARTDIMMENTMDSEVEIVSRADSQSDIQPAIAVVVTEDARGKEVHAHIPVIAETDPDQVFETEERADSLMEDACYIEKVEVVDHGADSPVIAATEPNLATKAQVDAEETVGDRLEIDGESDTPVAAAGEPYIPTEARADAKETVEDSVEIESESDALLSATVEPGNAFDQCEPLNEMKTTQSKAFDDSGIGLAATCLNLDLASTSASSLPDIINLTKSGSFEEESLGDDDAAGRSLPDVVVYTGSVAENNPTSELSPQLKEADNLHQNPRLSFGKYLKGDAVAEANESDLPDADGDASTSTFGQVTASSELGESSRVSLQDDVRDSLHESPDKLPAQTPQSLSGGDIREETCHWESLPFERDVGSAPTQSGSFNIDPPTVAGIKLPQFVSSITKGRNNEGVRGREGSIEKQVGRVEKETSKAQDVEDEITGDVQQITTFSSRAETSAVPEHGTDRSWYPEQTSGDMTVRPCVNQQTVTEDALTSASHSDEFGQRLQSNRSYHQQDLNRPTVLQDMIKVQQEYGSHTESSRDAVGPTLSHYREQEDSMTSHSTHQGTLQLQTATTMESARDDSGPVIKGACHYPQQDSANWQSPRLSTHQETLEFQNVSNLGSTRDNPGPILQGACHYLQQDNSEFTAPAQDQVMNFAQFQEMVSQLDDSNQYNIPNIQAEVQPLDDDAYDICSIIVDEIFNKAMAYIEDREMRIFSAFGIAQRPQSRVFTAAGAARGRSMAHGIMLPGVESRLIPVGEQELDGVETEQTIALGDASDIVEGATSGEVEPLDEKGLIKKSVDICKKFAPYAAGSATFGTLAYLMYKKLKMT